MNKLFKLILMIVLFSSCYPPNQNTKINFPKGIVGRWVHLQSKDTSESIIFLSNGIFLPSNGKKAIDNGRLYYKFISDSIVRINFKKDLLDGDSAGLDEKILFLDNDSMITYTLGYNIQKTYKKLK